MYSWGSLKSLLPNLTACLLLLGGAASWTAETNSSPKVLLVELDGVVHPVTVEIVTRAIEQARQEQAALLLIRLNTPGGLMEAMRQTIEKLVASPVPVATFVGPSGGRAASAGFFVLEAGDVAAMAPGTNTGAAHPVLLTGQQMDPELKKKAVNDASASLRSLVEKRGRNFQLAETAVRESRSFTEREAFGEKLIDLIAKDEQDLVKQLDGRQIRRFDGSEVTLHLKGATIAPYEPNIRQKVLSAISDPNVALVLIVLGILGVYIEFSAPGLIFPGVAGAILALLGLSALSLLPINWAGAALLLLSIMLFVLEAKIASHGILGIGGAVAMVLGSMLLVDSPMPEMRIRLSVALALGIPFAIITMFLVSLIIKARANKVVTGTAGMLGEIAVALTELAPKGKVMVRGEYWDAVSSEPVASGDNVRIEAVRGLQLAVKPVRPSNEEKSHV